MFELTPAVMWADFFVYIGFLKKEVILSQPYPYITGKVVSKPGNSPVCKCSHYVLFGRVGISSQLSKCYLFGLMESVEYLNDMYVLTGRDFVLFGLH